MSFLNTLINKLQATFPVNRIVVLLTPLFVSASAWIAGYVAKHFPGLPAFSSGQITAVMIAAAGAAIAAAYKWVDGWQKHEARRANHGSMYRTVSVKATGGKEAKS